MSNQKAMVAAYAGVLLYAGIIFLAAWKLLYWQGLLYVIVALIGTTLSLALVPRGSTITAERASKAGAG